MTKTKEQILIDAESFVREALEAESSGHDWWHIERVRKNAKKIAEMENADTYIVELAALLHDIADGKLNATEEEGVARVVEWLDNNDVSLEDKNHVLDIVTKMSFKGGNQSENVSTLEGRIVQDADRLDAMGAMGIARVMVYSGHVGRPVHDPEMKPRENLSLEEYRSGKDTAIMHFYEKLLKVKDTMNTDYARTMAEGRHKYLENYLEQFYAEWDARR